MEKKISYLSRNFSDYQTALKELTKEYYPGLAETMNDASVGSWFIDLNASVADALSYYIDRNYQETTLDSAQQTSSLNNIARTNGVKIPGPKASMCEVTISCEIPVMASTNPNDPATTRYPNWAYAPIVKRGTKFAAGSQVFELDHDVDFSHQFDGDGVSNRTYVPIQNSNGIISSYKVSKKTVVTAGESKIYKKTISSNDIKPFMEVVIPYTNVMGIESIILKDGTNLTSDPSYFDFMVENEYTPAENTVTGKEIYRFFEVDNLAEQYRWGDVTDNMAKPVVYNYGYYYNGIAVPTFSITKGEWKPVKQKFITEYTDNNYMKVIFGAGYESGTDDVDLSKAEEYSKYLISRMVNNDALGVLPKAGMTMYILYKAGGGSASNLAPGAINTITYKSVEVGKCAADLDVAKVASVKASLEVTNEVPSVSGTDRMDPEALRHFIKYYKGAQDRCVTVKDYHARVFQMPYKYGSAYRVGVTEENNKVMIYILGIDENGKLTGVLPDQYVKNLSQYLSEYRMINDFVEMKSGKIINLSFEVDAYIDKSYNNSDVASAIIEKVKDYMSIHNHEMGDEIFLGDLKKEISKIDGIINLIDLRVYNEYDSSDGYSSTQTTQAIYTEDECTGSLKYKNDTDVYCRSQIDLDASDEILYSDNDTMMEIKYPEKDIRVRLKSR